MAISRPTTTAISNEATEVPLASADEPGRDVEIEHERSPVLDRHSGAPASTSRCCRPIEVNEPWHGATIRAGIGSAASIAAERHAGWRALGAADALGPQWVCVTSRHVWVRDVDQHAGGPVRTPLWTDDHSRLVARSGPVVESPTEADVERVWNSVSPALAALGAPRRSRWRTVVGAGVAALVLGTSGVAAAGAWKARTGEFNTDAESVRLGGPGELIDPRGGDYENVLRDEISDIPFPSSAAREIAVTDQVKLAGRDVESMEMAQARGDADWRVVQITGGMRAEAARAAVCAWANKWAATTRAGDAEGRAGATEMLESARTWPAVTDVDPVQTITPTTMPVTDPDTGATHQEPVMDNTPFGYLPLVVDGCSWARPRGHGQAVPAVHALYPEVGARLARGRAPRVPGALRWRAPSRPRSSRSSTE